MSGSGLLPSKLTLNPVSPVANPCCNRVLLGVVPALVKAMRRRDFIKVIAGSAIVWPFAAHAQQRAMSVVGGISADAPDLLQAFRQGLKETGLSNTRTSRLNIVRRKMRLVGYPNSRLT
jgi:hypothetical protein